MNVWVKKVARDWRIKLLAQNLIGLLPGTLGFQLNESFVRLVRGGVGSRVDAPKRIIKGLENMALLYDKTEFTLSGKTVLEVGTGWHGIDLITFYLFFLKSINYKCLLLNLY